MNFEEAIKRNLASDLPLGPTDWYAKNLVPKDYKENIAFRRVLLDMCYSDSGIAREVKMICERDILFWINTFGFTLVIKDNSPRPVQPFITWAFQDEAILAIQDAIGKCDVCIPKSRDMGASWVTLLSMTHRWCFMENQSFLLASRKAELVDGKNDPKALMPKIEFFLEHLPIFLRPNYTHTNMSMINHDTESVFSGEATVENLATGDRRTAILLDETSKMDRAEMIFRSTRDVTRTRIFNSSPNGRFGIGEPFYRRCKINSDTQKTLFFHWTDAPTKREGLYYLDKDGKRREFEDGWKWQDEYSFDLLSFTGRKPRSRWYDYEFERSGEDEREMSQEVNLDFIGSGLGVVSAELITRWIDQHAKPPVMWGDLLVGDDANGAVWEATELEEYGNLKLWTELINGEPPPGVYAIGIDVSAGSGGSESSKSAAVVFDATTREQVARFAVRGVQPEDFATFCVGLGRWYHEAMLAPEINGPQGMTFMKQAMKLGYYNFVERTETFKASEKFTKKLGIANQDRGTDIFAALRGAISRKEITIYDEAIYREAAQFEWGDDGKIFHAGSREKDASTGDKGMAHGDLVIAAACGLVAVEQIGMERPVAAIEVDQGPLKEVPSFNPSTGEWGTTRVVSERRREMMPAKDEIQEEAWAG